jgi:prohibitin 1
MLFTIICVIVKKTTKEEQLKMSLFIIGLVLAIIAFIVLGFKSTREWKSNKKQLFAIIGVVIMLFSFFAIVPANNVGILYSPFSGGVQNAVYQEGFNVKGPFDQMYMVSTEVQSKRIENLSGQTKDSQYLVIAVDVKYFVDRDKAFDVFKKFKTLQNVNNSLVSPAAQRAIENACVDYNIIEILGSKRGEVYKKIEVDLQERFNKDGITLHSITFIDTDAGDDVENAIRAEAVAKKEVETAEQKRTKAEVEARTRIIEAEAEAKEKEILAAAIASSPEILELEWIKKWDGVLPRFMTGSGDSGGVIVDMNSLPIGDPTE